MVQRTVVQLVSDLTKKPADESVEFALDGTGYEIDLTSAEAARLRSAFERYVRSGRRLKGRRRRSATH